jgi:hypothetical protein
MQAQGLPWSEPVEAVEEVECFHRASGMSTNGASANYGISCSVLLRARTELMQHWRESPFCIDR